METFRMPLYSEHLLSRDRLYVSVIRPQLDFQIIAENIDGLVVEGVDLEERLLVSERISNSMYSVVIRSRVWMIEEVLTERTSQDYVDGLQASADSEYRDLSE